MKRRIIIMFLLLNISFSQDLIGEGLHGQDLIGFLREHYKTSTTLGYADARDVLYLEIERMDGAVEGIYTNFSVDLPDGVDPSTHLYENGINCEHVWPQSMYEGEEPTRSDMHALRPCKDNVNSARGNKPFNEIMDSQATTWYWQEGQTSNVPSSNIDEYSENHGSYFEPREDRKGDISRTMFYFYAMYSDIANGDFFDQQKNILKDWHFLDPSDVNELDRTWEIAEYQENKPNPFILDETLIERAFFHDDFMLGDLNGDENLNILDVVSLVSQILDEQYNFIGDMNGDGENNILDVITLLDVILS